MEQLSAYLEAQVDRGRHSFKEAATKTVLTGAVVLIAAGLLLATLLFVLYGAALGLAELSGRPWLGYMATGSLVFVLGVFWIMAFLRSLKRKAREKEARLDAAKAALMASLDPIPWTRDHPLPSAGVAMAVGFVAAVAGPGLGPLISVGTEILVEELLKKGSQA